MDHIAIATTLTRILEAEFSLLGFKFGLDALIGVFPVLGDIIPLALSFYLVWVAKHYNLPNEKISLIIRNIMFDFILGLVPVVGDFADFFYKSNLKNLNIIKDHLASKPTVQGQIVI